MSPKPDVYLISGVIDDSWYRQRAKQLGATDFMNRASYEEMMVFFETLAGKRVVLIDDDIVDLEETTELLENLEVEVHAFINPLEALKQIGSLQPETVLTDVQMPGADGFAVLTAINAMTFD